MLQRTGLEQRTAATLSSPEDLAEDLAETRRRGYAISRRSGTDATRRGGRPRRRRAAPPTSGGAAARRDLTDEPSAQRVEPPTAEDKNMSHTTTTSARHPSLPRDTPGPHSERLGLIAVIATFGGLLFGYDTGVINGALAPMKGTSA